MFCLRSWLPLLFIPTNASPLFIISFVALSYILHRPCIYCSALLVVLFISSCHWSERCFFDLRGDWFSPRFENSAAISATATATATASAMAGTSTLSTTMTATFAAAPTAAGNFTNAYAGNVSDITLADYVFNAVNATATAVTGAVIDDAKQKLATIGNSTVTFTASQPEWTGIGLDWIRRSLGTREWTLPCIDVKVRI